MIVCECVCVHVLLTVLSKLLWRFLRSVFVGVVVVSRGLIFRRNKLEIGSLFLPTPHLFFFSFHNCTACDCNYPNKCVMVAILKSMSGIIIFTVIRTQVFSI